MPDISMCTGEGCKKKKTCYRFTAKPSSYQSYFSVPPKEQDKCEYYYPVETPKKEKKK